MKALVLERKHELALREITIDEPLGPNDVRIAIHTVGICGSDVHYYTHGRIGPFVVEEPMVLGHEAAGTVEEVGSTVTTLRPGDRVCMEPGIPDPQGRATRLGLYNLDPAVRFWATPPVHGVLRPSVVHPAAFTFKLPDTVSFAEGAMVEPLAVGMHAARKARIRPGDTAVVLGAGPIGLLTALAALAGGCARVFISDPVAEKRALAERLGPITGIDPAAEPVGEVVRAATEGWGADIVFEASGNPRAAAGALDPLCPGGVLVLVGMPLEPIAFDVVAAQVKEARVETVFRYAHVYPSALALLGSGRLDVKPLITETWAFDRSVEAFEKAADPAPTSVKAQICLA
ncbi:MAG: NAD(P)-dependent alcohol dehydrogenase [Puniceicoccaceae bacterium]|nr:MAG: NAD(P)-dependent alcohol dehydrogenase [Puniceicoccaceae bacterium]